MANENINVAERIDTPSDWIDHNSLELVNGQRIVGSDLSTFINSLGGLAAIFNPQTILAILQLFIKPTPAPTPTPAPPVPTPVPNPVAPSFNLLALFQGIAQLLAQLATPTPAPINPTPTPAPVAPVNPAPIKMQALPAEKRPSKDEVLKALESEGVDVKVIPPMLLVTIIQLAIQFGLPFIQGLIAKFKK